MFLPTTRSLHPCHDTPVRDAASESPAPAGTAPSPCLAGAPTHRAGVICIRNGDHIEVHAREGTYRVDNGRWVFSPVQFPQERIPVRDVAVREWLAAEAAHTALLDQIAGRA